MMKSSKPASPPRTAARHPTEAECRTLARRARMMKSSKPASSPRTAARHPVEAVVAVRSLVGIGPKRQWQQRRRQPWQGGSSRNGGSGRDDCQTRRRVHAHQGTVAQPRAGAQHARAQPRTGAQQTRAHNKTRHAARTRTAEDQTCEPPLGLVVRPSGDAHSGTDLGIGCITVLLQRGVPYAVQFRQLREGLRDHFSH